MLPGRIGLSLVIPVYNGREKLEPLCRSLIPVLEGQGLPWEIILVDDGSGDGTFPLMEEIHRRDGRIRGGRLDRNRGQQNALYGGLSLSRGEWVITMDDDGQHRPDLIPTLLEKGREGFPVVYMVRRKDRRPLFYRLGSSLRDLFFRFFCAKPAGLRIGSFRLIRRDVVERILGETGDFVYLSALIFRRSPQSPMAHLFYTPEKETPSRRGFGKVKRIGLLMKLFWNYGPLSVSPRRGVPFRWESLL
ncbi:MAG: glycosyltransferase family 2 protein [Spirochaetales bacterium]|nr:glycosyltransferase family 2 protein [Spirochaetales bacterium]